MECNKDEATKAKQIAESRMQSGDFVGALKFAVKAKKLYADVENIAKILTICEVHSAAQNRLSGSGMDWYGILQAERFSDEATLKKQYRRLALLLHPDKNNLAGAEAAFKLIGEANRVLSDRTNRSLYEMNGGVSMKTAVPKTSSHHSNGNVFASKLNVFGQSQSASMGKKAAGVGGHCKGEQSKDGYVARGVAKGKTPKSKATKSQNSANVRSKRVRQSAPDSKETFNAGNGDDVKDANIQNVVDPGYVARGVAKGKAPKSKATRSRNSANVGSKRVRQSAQDSRESFNAGNNDDMKDANIQNVVGSRYVAKGKGPKSKATRSRNSANVGSKSVRQSAPDSRESFNAGNGDEMKDANIQNVVDRSRINARRSSRKKKHVSYAEADVFGSISKKPRPNEKINNSQIEEMKEPASGVGLLNNNNPVSIAASVGVQNRKMGNQVSSPLEGTSLRNKSNIDHVQGEELSMSEEIDVRMSKVGNCYLLNSNAPTGPDIQCLNADFSDFEKDKAESCFADNQFWAIYDDADTMPRFYALVKKVASPFKVQITWLEPDPDDEGEISWSDADLPIGCGKFKLGGTLKTIDRAMFSHQMHCIKGTGKGSYLVCPKKGETWAIFRDWDIKWNSDPEKHLKYEFDYVEILSDFTETIGIEVAYLGKVTGFVSLFHKTKKGTNIFCVLPNELYRFSHRIPSYKMTGNEKEGVPRGSFELDPAALPSNLFEVGDSGDVKMESDKLVANGRTDISQGGYNQE